ncbi:hypothetical protein DFP73DRAFT_343418 [Morchella snyderi]|nr:hypothetical protein DFP73DRAFT_343418 [Morchella snyderi]
MSHKSKNLQYEMEEPAFLRRLRQQHAGGGGPDRYIAPRNKKTAVDDEEDAPAYVMEGSEVSREEFDALTDRKGKQEKEEGTAAAGEESLVPAGEESTEAVGKAKGEEEAGRVLKENVTEIGVKGKKRKATKIGSDGEDEPVEKEEKGEVKGKKGKATKAGSKPKKRAVKLSFDQE